MALSAILSKYEMIGWKNRTTQLDMAPWSSGQDASLSRWNPGFDSPRSHLTRAKIIECDFSSFLRVRNSLTYLLKEKEDFTVGCV